MTDDPKVQLRVALDEAKKKGWNILTPSITTEGLSKMHAVTVEHVELSPEPKDGDVYVHGEGKMIIHKQGLEKLSNLAGVEVIKVVRTDAGNDRQYISYQAGGFIRKADGSVVMSVKTYGMDFEVIEEEVLEMYQERMKAFQKKKGSNQWPNTLSEAQREEWINDKARKEVRRRRKYKDQLCESGAQARVKRDLLGLKTYYTKQELQRPFVVVRIAFKPDYDDPEIKKMLTQAAISATGQLFGVEPQITHAPAADAAPNPQIVHHAEAEAVPEPAAMPNGDSPTVDADFAEEGGPPNPADVARDEFLGATDDERLKIIDRLVQRKGYDTSGFQYPIKDWKEGHLVKFYDTLVGLPDDDIPF